MSNLSQTVDLLIDRLAVTRCQHCGCDIDVCDLTVFDRIICPDCNLQGTVPCKLGPYLMKDRLGSGAMGTVYEAHDNFLNRTVAIKVLRKALGEDKLIVNKFKREAMAIAQLNHQNIAQIYSLGEQKSQPYIVMEYLPGATLKDMINDGRPINQVLILQIGVDIARALEAASEIGLIHGDVKPENIKLDNKENAKLVDFGLATFEGGPNSEGIHGTPYYISPERVLQTRIDTRSDMYSLGATLYHAAAGRPPFTVNNNSAYDCAHLRLKKDPPKIILLRKDINPDVARIISRMLEREPSRRYPNYTSLIGDMLRTSSSLINRQKPISTSKRHPPRTAQAKTVKLKQHTPHSNTSSSPKQHTPSANQDSSGINPVFAIIGVTLAMVILASVLNSCDSVW